MAFLDPTIRSRSPRKALLVGAALSLLGPATAFAQVPVGGEFLVHASPPPFSNDFYDHALAMRPSGEFVVVWAGFYNVFGQRFESDASKVGPEFQANTFTSYHHARPDVALDGSGGFVVVWENPYRLYPEPHLFGQRYDSAGSQVGSEFQVSTDPISQEGYADPAVAADAVGNFVVAWSANHPTGADIFAQRFDSAGNKLEGQFQVNTFAEYIQFGQSVAMHPDGSFVVVWVGSQHDYFPAFQIFGQRFDASGDPIGGEFRASDYLTDTVSGADVAMDAQGDFVVVWSGFSSPDFYGDVFGQRFDSAGTKLGGVFQVNSHTPESQGDASVATDAGGGFVVTWESRYQLPDPNSTFLDVFAQRYDGAGDAVGGEFLVNTFTMGVQGNATVGMDASGGFVVAWETGYWTEPGTRSVGQRFSATSPVAVPALPRLGLLVLGALLVAIRHRAANAIVHD